MHFLLKKMDDLDRSGVPYIACLRLLDGTEFQAPVRHSDSASICLDADTLIHIPMHAILYVTLEEIE